MPLTDKGDKIMKAMKGQYGSKKGESVFYAARNKGTIQGVEAREKLREAFRGVRRSKARKRG